jgi:hypothetical protein
MPLSIKFSQDSNPRMSAKYFGLISRTDSSRRDIPVGDYPEVDSAQAGRRDTGMRDWLVSLAIMAVYAAIQIRVSFETGSLAFPPTYDDVSYFISGASYLAPFEQFGLHAILRQFYTAPPHAPMSTALAFMGFSVLGVKAWAGPAINAVVLALFLRGFLGIASGLPFGQTLLLVAALLGFPLVGETLMVFRPDMFCSLLIAAGAFYILRPEWLTSRRAQLVAGLLFGAALWAKPTVFHLTAALFFAAMLLASLPSLRRRQIKAPLLAAIVTTTTGIVVSLPYYAIAFHDVVDYIWTTAFGTQASVWVKQIPLQKHLLFYLTGPIGAISLGLWLYAGCAIGVAAVLTFWWRSDGSALYRAALVVSMVVIGYLAVTIPAFKGPHGLPFAALFLGATAIGAVSLVRRLSPPLAWGTCLLLMLFSAWQFAWPYVRDHGVANPVFAAARWKMLHEVVDTIGDNEPGGILYNTTPVIYLNDYTVAFQQYVEGRLPMASDTGSFTVDPQEQRQKIARAAIILTPTPETIDIFPQLPAASRENRTETIRLIEESGLFQPPIRIVDPIGRDDMLLYKPWPPFSPIQEEQGLGPVEGPYPQFNLPRVRWGHGAQSAFVARGTANSQSQLVIVASGHANAGQTLSVVINGKAMQTVSLAPDFRDFHIPFDFDDNGSARILLRYGIPAANSVLYKTLSIRAAKS